jgi:hypothetical protein
MTTLTVEIPDGTDRSASVLRVEMWDRSLTSGCRSWVVLLDNQDDSLNGVFAPQNTCEIKLDTVSWMKGYVDTITHLVYDREDTFRHLLRVSGRDYSQDVLSRIHTESYPVNERIDDLIDDALDDTGSEINYASGSSESQIAGGYEAKDEFLINIMRDLFERESYDGWVTSAKLFTLTDLSSLTASGITLKSVADASDNNILATIGPIQYTEADGLPIKNYIKVIGQRVRDGWSDLNASDWTAGMSCAVSDDTTIKKVGAGSIKTHLTYNGANAIHVQLDFTSGLYSKTLNYLDWSIYGQEEMMWWARTDREGEGSNYCRPRLVDTTGNKIDYYNSAFETHGMTKQTWYWLGAPVGTEMKVTAGLTADRWHWITNVDDNFNWKIEYLGFWSVGPGTAEDDYQDDLWIDDMRLPEEMVSISEDAGSQASYRKRCIPIRKPYFINQKEVDDYATALKTVLKDPPEYLKVWVDGPACIVGGAKKSEPTYSLTVNVPRLGINSETWRIVNVHHVIEPYVDLDGNGHDWVAEFELVPSSTKIVGFIYDALASGKIEPQIARLEDRIRGIEKKRSLSHLDVTTRRDEGGPW